MRISDWSSDVCSSDLALALRYASVIFMEGLPMITRSKSSARKAHKVKNTNLNPVTNVMKLCSISLDTVWTLIVGWSRSEESLAGEECDRTYRTRWSTYHKNKKNIQNTPHTKKT